MYAKIMNMSVPMKNGALILAYKCTKVFGGRAPPGAAGGAYSTPLNLLAGFKVKGQGKGKEKNTEGEGTAGRRSRRWGRDGREGTGMKKGDLADSHPHSHF